LGAAAHRRRSGERCRLRLGRHTEDAPRIARGVDNPDDLERLSFMPVADAGILCKV